MILYFAIPVAVPFALFAVGCWIWLRPPTGCHARDDGQARERLGVLLAGAVGDVILAATKLRALVSRFRRAEGTAPAPVPPPAGAVPATRPAGYAYPAITGPLMRIVPPYAPDSQPLPEMLP